MKTIDELRDAWLAAHNAEVTAAAVFAALGSDAVMSGHISERVIRLAREYREARAKATAAFHAHYEAQQKESATLEVL